MRKAAEIFAAMVIGCSAMTVPVGAQAVAVKRVADPGQTAKAATVMVDDRCRVLTQDRVGKRYNKPAYRADASLCHFESVHQNEIWEQHLSGTAVQRTPTLIDEHVFVLTNVTAQRVLFLVHQTVPTGWRIDSTPQPARMVGNVAVFNVFVDPGMTVRLHVGARHVGLTKHRMVPVENARKGAPTVWNRSNWEPDSGEELPYQ